MMTSDIDDVLEYRKKSLLYRLIMQSRPIYTHTSIQTHSVFPSCFHKKTLIYIYFMETYPNTNHNHYLTNLNPYPKFP